MEEATVTSTGYCLYFKGLTRMETTRSLSGFGVAICRHEDDKPFFQMKGSLHGSVLEAELTALNRGLTEAVSLGVTHILICCDNHHIFELVMGRSAPAQENIAMLMDDVQRIRQQFTYSIPVLVTRNQTNNFAYKLAMETIVSEIRISMPPFDQKKTCYICFFDDFEDDQMFSVGLCGHRFCVECVERYIQVELLKGCVPRGPHYGCKSNLTLGSYVHLLTPKQREMFEQRVKHASIPPWDSLLLVYVLF
ncbi:unnamed protein product [Arabis nemorensis]|uniref:RING-type domain-containing protein n=1 Tax=Arabis nemorensis TaxID=586526 RepID=A0A565BTG0_9BRAS|nr:unnamed protein product [Arabis nemorensis]